MLEIIKKEMLGRWVGCSIDPVAQHIMLKIDGFQGLLNERVAVQDASNPHDFTQQVWPLRSLFGQLDNCRQLLLNRNFCIYAHLNEWYFFFFQFWNFHLEIFPSFTKFLFILAGISDTFCHKEIHKKMKRVHLFHELSIVES